MAGSIDRLIVNGPCEEPERHWRYDRESRTFSLETGRRPSGYVVATPGSKSFDDAGVFVELPLVNRIRPRVQALARLTPRARGDADHGPRGAAPPAPRS